MMNMQNENFITENNFEVLFPNYILEVQTNFKYNKEIYNILQKLKKQHKNMSQTPDTIEGEEGHYQTIGGYQTTLEKSLTEYNSTDKGITKKDEEVLKSLQKNVFDYAAIKYIEKCQFNFTRGKELLYKNWFVEYNKNSFQEIHTHGFTLFTMVYFVKVPKQLKYIGSQPKRKEGSLVITDTKTLNAGLGTKYITPEKGKIVVFPGDYPHYTLPVVSDDTRAVIVEDIFVKEQDLQ